MRQFVHHRLQRLEQLLRGSVSLHAELRDQAPGFEASAKTWLADATQACEELGLQSQTATLARLQTDFDLAARNIDARQQARVDTFRRQFRQAAWSNVLASAQATLQDAYGPELATRDHAGEQLGKMVIAALQAGVLSEALVEAARDNPGASRLWGLLRETPQFSLVARQLLLTIIDQDAVLLLVELAERISAPPATQSTSLPQLQST